MCTPRVCVCAAAINPRRLREIAVKLNFGVARASGSFIAPLQRVLDAYIYLYMSFIIARLCAAPARGNFMYTRERERLNIQYSTR